MRSPFGVKTKILNLLEDMGYLIIVFPCTFSFKEIIKLNHESFDRALYSEGAITAAKWLKSKKPGLYSMRDVLNFE